MPARWWPFLTPGSRWRRTRPLLGFAAAATLILITLIAAAGMWGAKEVTRESEQNVTAELVGSLARTAGYSAPAVERRLQRQVGGERRRDERPRRRPSSLPSPG